MIQDHPHSRRRRLLLRPRIPWNVYSAILNPLVTLLASTLILYLHVSREMTLISLLPLVVLAVGSLGALIFWCCRLLMGSVARTVLLLRIGALVHAVGIAAFAFLVLVTCIGIMGPTVMGVPLQIPTGSKHWVFVIWASLESSQHYLYKLSFGRVDTLGHVIRQGGMEAWRLPRGGAIGIQLRKLRRQQLRKRQRVI